MSVTNTLATDGMTSTASIVSSTEGDLSAEGLLLRGLLSVGTYELGDNDLVSQSGDLLIGYQFKTSDFRLRAFGGLTMLNRDFDNDEEGAYAGGLAGGKIMTQLLANHNSPYHMSVTGHYATTLDKYGLSIQVGLKKDDLAFGPDVTVLGSDTFESYRLGMFINGMKLGGFKLNTEAGYGFGSEEGGGDNSPYLKLGTSKSF
ncbi:cellulose biosynthesis protein BcsS [Aestuariivirga sp.]|uniref:cellulose biosynthesis protein BcsS n=1 Tax=Aestuariivirga sp. TaxID=2650926 RepID=UPI0037830823